MNNKPEKMAVLAILQAQDQAISLAELLSLLGHNFSERTLRRRLTEMVTAGLVQRSGQKRGTRYKISQPIKSTQPLEHMNFSAQSSDAINRIRQPLFERSPVTYNQKWLDAYEPNKTFHLNKEIRTQLQTTGEKSKNHLPAGTYARHIYNRLLIDLSYNSSRLEGNTYSLLDTQRLILEGTGATDKLDEEKIMILNHKEAIAHLVNNAHKLKVDVNEVCTLHYLLADGLIPTQYAGKVRDYGVRIASSTYIPWENPEKLKKQLQATCQKAALIQNPFEQSLFLLAHIAYLQAFIDVNKRTSRLSANIPLIQQNLVPLSFNDINSDDYISAMIAIYELNDINPLIELYAYSYLRTCKLYEASTEALGFDEIRVRYRPQRREIIRYIITHDLSKNEAQAYIQEQSAQQINKNDQANFIEDVEEDINEINAQRIVGLGISVQQLNNWLKKYHAS